MPGTEKRISRGESRLVHLALWSTLAVGLVAVIATHADYGVAFDEPVTAEYGERSLRYFATAGRDRSCNEFLDLRYYGPLIEMIPALAYDPDEPGKYEVRHLFLGLMGLLGVPAIWLYARRFPDPRVAIFAILALVALPRFYGHWFNNSKDLPFATLVTWFMAALAATFAGRRVLWRNVIGCGVAMGLALCGRPGGFPLFLLFLAGAALSWLLTREEADAPEEPGRRAGLWTASRRLAPKLIVVVVVAWPIMVAPWPWAHENVLVHPLKAMRVAAEFHTTMPVLFGGVEYWSSELPAHYVAGYVLIGTPLPILLLALAGLATGVRAQVADWRSRRSRMVTLTQMWLFVPLVVFAVVRPNVYGGMRHFLFVLPAVAVFAATGAAAILSAVLDRVRGPRGRALAWTTLLVVVLLPVRHLVSLHPYQMTFYNSLVGGVAGAQGQYWTDYPLASYREAVLWVNERAAESPGRRVTVWIAAPPPVMAWIGEYAAANVELMALRDVEPKPASLDAADYYIATTRNELDRRFPDAPIVHEVGRDGAVFTVIRGRGR